jgi:D-glucosaminate-6-phosphate ammonia-lyase
MKVGREEVVGLIVALRRFAAGSDDADRANWHTLLDLVQAELGDLPHVALCRLAGKNQILPMLALDLDEPALDLTAYDALNRLLEGDPPIAVAETRAEFGTITVNPQGLNEAEAAIVGRRLREVLS